MFIFDRKQIFTVEGMERKEQSKRKGLSRNSGERTIHIRILGRSKRLKGLKDIKEKGVEKEKDKMEK